MATPASPTGVPQRLPIFALLIANAVSLVGSMLTSIAVPWFVLLTTGSAAKTGLTAFFSLLPLVLGGFFGGALVDRLGFKRTSVGADLLSGLAVAAIPLLYATGRLAFWQLLILVFVRNLFDIPGGTARQSMIPDLARAAAMDLGRANASVESIRRFATLLGPPLAGVLIAAMGQNNVLFLDAASFLVSAAVVGLAVPALRCERSGPVHYLSDLREGLRFLRADRLVVALITVLALTNVLLNPLFIVILPVYANVTSGSALNLGLMIGAFGGGTLAGAILFGLLGPRLPRRALLTGGMLVTGLPLWLLSTLPPLPITAAALAVMGLALGPLGPLALTVLGERTPDALRGRVFGAFGTLANMWIPLGVLETGYLLDAFGASAIILGLAVVYLIFSLSTLFIPVFHQLRPPAGTDDAPGPPAPAAKEAPPALLPEG
jgi:MFS family permease